jgi:hypothetical protein
MPMPQKPVPARFCRHCGKPLARKRINGRLEDRKVFLSRVYCDRVCMAFHMQKPIVTKAAYHWRARRMLGPACERCGGTDHLHAHHRNHDVTDNRKENIETICRDCHTKEHISDRRRGAKAVSVVPRNLLVRVRDVLERVRATSTDPALRRLANDAITSSKALWRPVPETGIQRLPYEFPPAPVRRHR